MEELFRLTGKPLVLYSNSYTARTIWEGEITKYPLWIAEYEVSKPRLDVNWNTYYGYLKKMADAKQHYVISSPGFVC